MSSCGASIRPRDRERELAGRVSAAVGHLDDLAQSADLDVEDEAPDVVDIRNERRRPDARKRLAHVDIGVGEGIRRPRRFDPGLVLNRVLELVVGEVSMPQSVWWIRMILQVPSSRWLMVSERISSSVTTRRHYG